MKQFYSEAENVVHNLNISTMRRGSFLGYQHHEQQSVHANNIEIIKGHHCRPFVATQWRHHNLVWFHLYPSRSQKLARIQRTNSADNERLIYSFFYIYYIVGYNFHF